MRFRKTPFALAAIVLCGAIPLGAQTTAVTIEAETMSRNSNYLVQGARIVLKSPTVTGTASQKFSGTSGTYDMQVYVHPETDGQSTLEVYRDSTLLQKYTYPRTSVETSFTVKGVALSAGQTIKLVGRGNEGAIARVDKIVLTKVATSSTPPTTSTPTTSTPTTSTPTTSTPSYSGTPYSGTPVALPKAFEASKFDKGGMNVAYKDLSAGNAGNVFRTSEDVDLISSTDAEGGPYAVNKFQTGEWLAYTVNVPQNGSYDLAIRAANNQSTPASFRIEVDGVNVTGPISVPNTGSWSGYKWVGKQGVNLSAGKRVLKVVSEQEFFNMSAVSVLASAAQPASTPPAASPSAVTIEAEKMIRDANYLVDGVRIALKSPTVTGTASQGFSGASGTYDMEVHVHPETDGQSTLEVYKGSTLLQKYLYPRTSVETSFAVKGVALSAGETIKLVGRGNEGAIARVDKIVLTPVAASAPAPAPAPTEPAPSAPAPVEPAPTAPAPVEPAPTSPAPVPTSPAPAPAPSVALPTNLLFWSGFENGVVAEGARDCYRNGCYQDVTGADLATGFVWPPKLPGSTAMFQLMVAGAQQTTSSVGNYMHNEIQTVTGRDGKQTKALYNHISQSGCCGTDPQGSGATQNPYMLFPTSEVPEMYISYWVKLQPDLVKKMAAGTWRELFEWKTQDTDRRVKLEIVSYGGTPYWQAMLDQRITPKKEIWRVINKQVPVPVDEWFKVEVYWRRSGGSDGRVWMAINGNVIADKYGSNMGPNKTHINRIFVSQLYSGSGYPIYQWVDDLQIWSTFPKAAPGDPWYNAPYASH